MAVPQRDLIFGAGDYAVFAVMLAVSLAIGIYYGIRDRGAKNGVQTYLMGGRQMHFAAVGMSISFSFISAVTILGIPSEIYIFGSMYVWLLACLPIVLLITTEIYIPLYFRLNITSTYEYLQLRFNYAVRILGTLAYIAQTVLYIGVMIYAPSLAFSQVSGFNLWAAIFTTGIVCTIYTTLGGLKAVIWTDVFQGAVVTVILIVVMFMSADSVGGWNEVWLANSRSNRFDFLNFDFDPRVRHSFWSIIVGLTMLWTSIFATTQSQVQRYLACSTERNAKFSMVFGLIIAVVVLLLCTGLGWVMYAYFEGCDPLISGQVSAPDQLLPFMIMKLFQQYPGLTGAFMAGVYAGCMSTVSSGINAMACVTSEDFIRPFVKWTDSTMTIVAKLLVFAYGIICIGFACLSTVLGNILQTTLSLLGVIGGPTLGLYTLGAIFPMANSWSSFAAFFVGLALNTWIYAGSRDYPLSPQLTVQFWRPKVRTIAQCPVPDVVTTALMNSTVVTYTTPLTTADVSVFNITTTPALLPVAPTERPPVADMYAVSYAYYTSIGMCTTLIFGLVVSLLTCGHRRAKDIDPNLVVPLFDHWLIKPALPKSFRRLMWCGIDRENWDEDSYRPPTRESPKKDTENGEENPAFEMK
uniref:sodium-coupled monocarboxylate transporter 2-like n=1 Tax=Styela clava TaxID=7725 RepID=UPI001939EB89|nr:sodium-coupled monocarboxylate transporter 2-like [Styela clava]